MSGGEGAVACIPPIRIRAIGVAVPLAVVGIPVHVDSEDHACINMVAPIRTTAFEDFEKIVETLNFI